MPAFLTPRLLAVVLCGGLFVRSVAAQCPAAGPNLLRNGDFEAGYWGFTSDFGRGLNNATKGDCNTQGWILVSQTSPHVSPACQFYPPELSAQYGPPNTETHPDPKHPSNTSVVTLATCSTALPDHTSGQGFFLTIDPDNIPGRAYWKQRVHICANTDYVFSCWVRNVEAGCGLPAPNFHFEVGGMPINSPTGYPDCFWVKTAAYWNSGALEGDVLIQLVNDQPGCIANDVAIDDVFFGVCGEVFLTCDAAFQFCKNAAPATLRLSGQALGFDPPRYQWQGLDATSSSWKNITGAADSVYLLQTGALPERTYYRLLAVAESNGFGPGCFVSGPVVTVDLYPQYAQVEKTGICAGEQYAFGGRMLSEAGTYADSLTSVHGCDSVRVLELGVWPHRMLENDAAFAYVPNAFSPNDDGLNDVFLPAFADANFLSYDFQVFDRWGSLVFSTRDPAAGWDGLHRGRDCAAGVYTYFIVIRTGTCTDAVYRGGVMLVR